MSSEVGNAHRGVAADLLRRAICQQRAFGQHQHAVGEVEDQVHVVLDHQNGQVAGQRVQRVQHHLALPTGHAGHGFIQQQHLRFECHGECDLHQALLAVGQPHRAAPGQGVQTQGVQDLRGLVAHGMKAVECAKHLVDRTFALVDGQLHLAVDGQIGCELRDLERTRETTLHAFGLGKVRHVLPTEPHATLAGCEHAGDEVDQRGFARAVGPDKTHPVTRVQRKRHVARDVQTPERFVQLAHIEQRLRTHATPRATGSRRATR